MLNIISQNKLVTIVATLVIAGAVWYGFSSGAPSSAVLGTENVSGAVNPEDQDIVTTLLKLRSVTLTGTIFSSKVFSGLKDFGTQIIPEDVGRPDPFAPIPTSISQSASVAGASDAGGATLFNKPKP